MKTCQKWVAVLVSLQLLAVGTFAIPSPGKSSSKQAPEPVEDGSAPVQLDSDTGDDRELKSDDDGYDFLSIDQLFLNNPQYRQLISDLQAHTFGSNWRRKRDVSENELPEAFRSDESLSSPRASTVPTTTTTTSTTTTTTSSSSSTTLGSSGASSSTESLDVASNRDISSTTSDMPKAAALTSNASSKTKEVTKPSTAGSASVTGSSTTTSTATSTPTLRGSSTVATSASYGSSGSTEVPLARNATLEMTTAAAPIRASTPRRLSHKNGSNKNKNKLSAAAAQAANKPTTNSPVGPSTVNVNKVSVSSNAVASSNQLTQQTPPAVSIPAPENGTVAGPAANNKDKAPFFKTCRYVPESLVGVQQTTRRTPFERLLNGFRQVHESLCASRKLRLREEPFGTLAEPSQNIKPPYPVGRKNGLNYSALMWRELIKPRSRLYGLDFAPSREEAHAAITQSATIR
uniref:Uncharacterized protein n=1 Tax=Anopheles farauti TaxID=69004 RepID=A0A182QM06_9DIPT